MKPMISLIGMGLSTALGSVSSGQSPKQLPVHLVGQAISGSLEIRPNNQRTAETATLTFRAPDSGPVMTVDFKISYIPDRPQAGRGVVDVVVTQHPVEDDTPEMMVLVNGRSSPLATRLQGRRSVAATISFDEFLRILDAATIAIQAFNSELEVSAVQSDMLRGFARRWKARLQK